MSLFAIIGPMFSGKTTYLVNTLSKHRYVEKCLYINSILDDRNGTENSTHNLCLSFNLDSQKTNLLYDVDVSNYTMIGIDEGQFFQDLEQTVKIWIKMGKHVVVAGLKATFEQTGFGQIPDILAIADKIKMKRAICACGSKAAHTKKIGSSTNIIDIGGSNKYVACCHKCYHKQE